MAQYAMLGGFLVSSIDALQATVPPRPRQRRMTAYSTSPYISLNVCFNSGNNVIASRGAPTPQSGPGEFIYPWDPTAPPTSPGNVNAAVVNAFYVVNTVHDFSYRYGFTEVSHIQSRHPSDAYHLIVRFQFPSQ